jgi:hypothetical protein
MFIFGYAAKPSISWVAPTVGLALYAGTSFIVSLLSSVPRVAQADNDG